jgi:hypothetical protein
MPVTRGVLFGIFMGVFLYGWESPWPLRVVPRTVTAAIGGVVCGAVFGILVAVTPPTDGWWHIRQVSVLPPSDRVAVMRAVRGGEPVSDLRLAPGVLAYAEVVMARTQKQLARHVRWQAFALAALGLVVAVVVSGTGRAWVAVFFGAAAVMWVVVAWRVPGALERQLAKAQAAADSAADQIGQ